MKAKTYLEQIRILDTKIQQKQMQLNDLKLKATCTGGISYGERVQTSPSGDSLCNAVTRYIALEQEINDDVDYFVDKKSIIINQIHALTDVDSMKILHMRYVQYYTFEKIAVEMNYCIRQVYRIHGSALQDFEKVMNK